MAKYINVDNLHFPNIAVFEMKLHGATVPMVRLVDLQKLSPEEDVQPVVRCKDCKYAHMTYDGKCKYCDTWDGEEDPLYLDGDFYCGFGERKDSGT